MSKAKRPVQVSTPWMTSREAAQYIKVGYPRLLSMVKAGDIPAFKEKNAPKARFLIHRDELDKWVQRGLRV